MILSILLVSLVIFSGFGNAEKPYPDPIAKVKLSTNFNVNSGTVTGIKTEDPEVITARKVKTPRPLGSRSKYNSDGETESDSNNSPGKTADGGSETPISSSNGDSRLGLSPRSKSRERQTSSNSSSTSPNDGYSSAAEPNPCSSDKVPFSCYNQAQLKDYCTQNFGTVQVTSGNQGSGMKRYTVDLTKKANWYEAVGLCRARNMTLATVESYNDQRALSETLNNAGTVQNAWLSATDLGQTNNYVWMSTGQPVTWTNWYNGEPNHENSGNQTEHCIEVINYRWKWNDNLCENQEYFVCQYYSYN